MRDYDPTPPGSEERDFLPEDIDVTLDEAHMISEDKDQELPEAPASGTMKAWVRGYGVMITTRDNRVSNVLKKIETMVDYAESHKWKTSWETVPVGQVTMPQPTNPQVPICGVHGTVMQWKTGVSKKSGKSYAFWSCPTKNADNSYCKFQPEK
jgi:hypothetical protein